MIMVTYVTSQLNIGTQSDRVVNISQLIVI